MSDDDNSCCCCLMGLAVGYYLGENHALAETLSNIPISRTLYPSYKDLAVAQIDYYQKKISPLLRATLNYKKICRFQPSCSEYSKIAFTNYGIVKGFALSAFRLIRCNPLNGGGIDPVKSVH